MVTLPKSTHQERLIENASVEFFEISKEDMDALDALDERLVTDWYVSLFFFPLCFYFAFDVLIFCFRDPTEAP